MTVSGGIILAVFVLIATNIAIGYGYGVKAGKLPFSTEIGFNNEQLMFLNWWIKLAVVFGILAPITLCIQTWGQPTAWSFWGSYFLVVAVQLASESGFSRWLVSSAVVPIGFCYSAFRLWQLLDGFHQLSLSHLGMLEFTSVVLFWMANVVMLMTLAIPTIYQKQRLQE